MRRFILILCVAMLCLPGLAQGQNSDITKSYYKIARLFSYIDQQYIDTVNIPMLTDKAIIEVLKNLDPHSTYVSKDDYKTANEPLEGNFEGVGVEFSILNDTLLVVSPVSGGPSEQVGIQSGDRIITVDGKTIAGIGIKNEDVFKLLRGPKGTKVKLGIERKGDKELLVFEVTRNKIPIYSVDASYEIKPGTAYIKLSRFALTSMKEIQEAFGKLSTQPEALILDLRGNSGGILPTAIHLADQFLDERKIIVSTEGLHIPPMPEYSTKGGLYKKGKLIVLIDEGSASASEIVAGAIQDWDRGILIGRRSFGKGLVQQQLPLGDGSYIRLTIARYHTPSGRVIQRPYVNGKADKYNDDYLNRFKNGELYSIDSLHLPDSLKFQTMVSKRTVFGGGGIMPDIYVPYDTTSYSAYYGKLIRTGILNRFILSYMDKNRASLQQSYKTFDDYAQRFTVSDKLIDELVSFAEKEKLPRDDKGLETSDSDLRILMKAYIARDLWTVTEYYRIVNANRDSDFQKALDVLDRWDYYVKELDLPASE